MTAAPTPTQRETVLRAATSAPSKYNTQPWWFRWDGGDLEVHVDPTRRLPRSDPAGREAVIACGAATFAARLGYAACGFGTAVEGRPDEDDPLFAARVRVVAEAPDPRFVELHPYLARRRTDRGPFQDTPVPTAVLDELGAAARAEDAWLRVAAWEPAYDHLLALIREATWLEEQGLRDERAAWVDAPDAARRREGVGAESLGPLPEQPTGTVRDLAVGRDIAGREHTAFEARPTIAVLETASDTRGDWLAAGQALLRVLVTATRRGVAASFANQPLEDEELRFEAGHLTLPPGEALHRSAQMILRLGLSTTQAPSTPRRAPADVLEPPTWHTSRSRS
ncbi:Acg family FMN-binding oxidoreductase [Yinghuangia seranimata]|uniref:Acg family FMN-binding oxidoreductase n=1 Tax=Yinghuangia seranimata TaxID=408067 RepID=UPI00248AD523|nr:nitroreductase family protein [Yinghuangia seranimata]MDI2124788.1 nitroreductase family protein [Yinghuangia seranimata]